VFQFPEDTIQAILAKYPDSGQLPNWAKKSVATALYVGLVNTDEQANIAPNNPMTRGDVAYALSKYLNAPKQQSPEVLEEQLRQEDNF
jgi:putative alpha-1,2-mannosidase